MAATVDGRVDMSAAVGTLGAMGFNPFRRQRKTIVDVAIVIGFAVLTFAAVAWAFLG